MAPAELDAPAPWTAVGDGQVWRLPFTALGRVDVDEVDDAPALFPGLVSIGADRTGRVLVNLEAAHGLISVTGPPAMTTEVLSAMAMELATSRWSDQMRITLAGFGDDLIPLAPDRITAVPTVDEALPALEAHAAEIAEAMAEAEGELRAGRALARRGSGRLGAALPDQRGATHPVGAQPAARARPGRPRRRGWLRGRRRRPRLRLGLGSHARRPAAGRGTRLRRAGPAHPGPSARSAGGPVRGGGPAGGRAAHDAAPQRGAAAAPGTWPGAAGGSHRPRPRLGPRRPGRSSRTGSRWPPSSWSTWPCIPAECTPTC